MAIRRTVEPAVEPITLDQAKAHLRLRTADQDARVTAAIAAARDAVERITERALLTQTWARRLDAEELRAYDRWHGSGVLDAAIELPRPPVQAILGVTFAAPGVAPVAVDAAAYELDADSEPGRLVWAAGAYGTAYGAFAGRPAALRIVTRNGYGDAAAAVPAGLVQCVYQIMATYFLHREEGIVLPAAQALEQTPATVREILEAYRLGTLV
jgi:uncharacterized phiE125 gp8 family phage protein